MIRHKCGYIHHIGEHCPSEAMTTTNQPEQADGEQPFLCPSTGTEHWIGHNAVDVGHGARPSGPQICLNCRLPLQHLIARSNQLAAIEAQLATIDEFFGDFPKDKFLNTLPISVERIERRKKELQQARNAIVGEE